MCDSVVALGPETAAGVALFAKNSDRQADECQPFVQYPAAHHAPGARVGCTHVEIPQVPETYRVMGHSPWWVWGFEHGLNEHQVAIGNHSVFSNEPIEAKPGLIGMDLVRLGLERGRSARESLEVIATLVEGHGQGGPAVAPGESGYHNSFLLADAREAWMLETSNRRWAARRVRLTACSNHLTLRDDWEIASRDVESFARAEGWWRSRARLDLAAAYRNPHVPPHISSGRHRRALELLEEGRGAHDVASFQRLLRDHGTDGAAWTEADADPSEERYFTLCAHSPPVHWTTASMVAALPDEDAPPLPVWVSFGTPCSGIFLPVYLAGVLPAALARPDDSADAPSAWWRFKRLQDAVSCDPVGRTAAVREGWAPFETELERERRDVEREATASGDAEDAAEILTAFMLRVTQRALERADTLRARLAE
jgi:secernin